MVVGVGSLKLRGEQTVATSSEESILPPKWVMFSLVASLFVWLVWELKEIASLLVVAYCISYLIDPLVSRLQRYRINRSFGIVLTFILLFIVGFFLVGSAIPTLVRDYEKFSERLPQYATQINEAVQPVIEKVETLLKMHAENGNGVPSINEMSFSWAKNVLVGMKNALLKGYSLTLTILNLILLPFFVFYVAADFKRLHHSFLAFFPSRNRSKVKEIGLKIDHYVSSFVRGQLTVGVILSALYALGLAIVGLDLWFLLAVISGFGNIIPYFGFIVGITLSSVIAIFSGEGFAGVAQVWLVFIIVQALEGTLITPRIIGDKVGLSPLVIILAIVAGGQIFGFLGIILAVPLAAALRVVIAEGREWFFGPDESEALV